MGIIIHSLESVSFKDLYAAFSSAFKDYDFSLNADELRRMLDRRVQSPNQKIPDRKTKCVIKTHINIKQNVIFGAKLKPV